MYRDFETYINAGWEREALPHYLGFQVFIDTVEVKLNIDMYIYISIAITSIFYMIMTAIEFGVYFSYVGSPYNSANAWQNIINDIEAGKDIDRDS